jgi:hypothetical protein
MVAEPKDNQRPSASNLHPSEPVLSPPSGRVEGFKKGLGRGGRRPGSGAPKGNLNALKHGERSKQFARLGKIVADSPQARRVLLRYARRADAEQRRADELAGNVIEQVLSRGLARGRDRLILLPELLDEERTIRKTSRKPGLPKRTLPRNRKNTPSDNQSPNTDSPRPIRQPRRKSYD